jgi:hypothetical protein
MTDPSDVLPVNLAEELERFTQDQSYQPQFAYAKELPLEALQDRGVPRPEFVKRAEHVLQLWANEPESTPPIDPEITQQWIQAYIEEYFDRKGIRQPLPVEFLPHQVARCMVTARSIRFRADVKFSRPEFFGLIAHELETHFLRRYNGAQHHVPKSLESDQGRTEEGLASLHSCVGRNVKLLHKAALRYYTTWLGQTLGFAEVYQKLRQMGISEKKAIRGTLRAKRGQTDTSRPGGYTKDIIYFEGAYVVTKWLADKKNRPEDLYLGRISLENVAEAKAMVESPTTVLPDFMTDLEKYRQFAIDVHTQNFVISEPALA